MVAWLAVVAIVDMFDAPPADGDEPPPGKEG